MSNNGDAGGTCMTSLQQDVADDQTVPRTYRSDDCACGAVTFSKELNLMGASTAEIMIRIGCHRGGNSRVDGVSDVSTALDRGQSFPTA